MPTELTSQLAVLQNRVDELKSRLDANDQADAKRSEMAQAAAIAQATWQAQVDGRLEENHRLLEDISQQLKDRADDAEQGGYLAKVPPWVWFILGGSGAGVAGGTANEALQRLLGG